MAFQRQFDGMCYFTVEWRRAHVCGVVLPLELSARCVTTFCIRFYSFAP